MYLGLDIGTTSICAVVLDETGRIVFTTTRENKFHGHSSNGERTQDPDAIASLCEEIYIETVKKHSIRSIGISGQMHGILYVDKNGKAKTPLYSWQDERGNQPYEKSTYAEALSEKTGYRMATGFGCTSVFYDCVNGRISDEYADVCTIGDYVALQLTRESVPLLHDTMAASLGLYDLKSGTWDYDAMHLAGLQDRLFPKTTKEIRPVGYTKDSIPVYTAIGDNQASVYGAEQSPDTVIVNIGTGSQVSIIANEYSNPAEGCEYRPYFHGRYLAIGCALCGGYSYKLLKDFFNTVSKEEITYDRMNQWAEEAYGSSLPVTSTLFRGTRANPNLRASITNLSESNFKAQAVTLSTLRGISDELKQFYNLLIPATGVRKTLVGSGNAVRMNPVLKRIIQEDFGMDLKIPLHTEEAAFGAALAAAEAFEKKNLKHFIRYTT